MYKVPRERTKERKRPFVHSARFKPPLKTLFALRKCVFRERRRIESRETLLCGWVENESKEESFPTKTVFAKREEGVVGGVDFFVLSFLKKAFIIQSKLAGGEKEPPQNENAQRKRKNEKRGHEKARTESFIFPSKQKERKTTCVFLQKRVYYNLCSLKRALSKKKREVRERLLHSRKAE